MTSLALLLVSGLEAQMPDPPRQVKAGDVPQHEAYLFAHMIHGDYWCREQYPGVAYGLSVAASLKGPWFQVAGGTHYQDWDKYSLPPKVRHGSMLPISRKQYDALVAAFGKPALR